MKKRKKIKEIKQEGPTMNNKSFKIRMGKNMVWRKLFNKLYKKFLRIVRNGKVLLQRL